MPPFDGADGYIAACQDWAALWRPRVPLSISAWAAAHRRLSGKTAAEPGPWSNERVPYLAAIMDALDRSHPASVVVLAKSTQIGASECALNWIGRTIQEEPASFLALFPSEKGARKWMRTRLNVMIAETPTLRKLIPLGRKAASLHFGVDWQAENSTLQEKHYPGGVLFTGSANIPEDIASISVAYLLLDEIDRFTQALEDEGDPVDIAERRTANFPRRKIFKISSPTTEETSRVWPSFLASTQDRYHVPCPDCGHMQTLRFANLTWPEGKPKQAMYRCESCAVLFEERHKTEMLRAGEWRADFPEREAEIKGFHINGLYSPIGLGDSWSQHAVAWDRAKGNPIKTQVFMNTRAGEPVKSGKERVDWQVIKERAEPYKLRTIPQGVLLLSSGTDVQHDRLETVILGHSRGDRISVIDYDIRYGDPTRDDVWRELDDYLARSIDNSFGVPMRITTSAIDSGNWQHEVTNFTRTRRARNIIACKGSSIATRQPIGKPTMVDVNYRGKDQKHGAEQYQIGVSVLKTLIYRRLNADTEATIANRHFHYSTDLNEEFYRQWAAEVFDPKAGWVKIYDRNEVLDTIVLAIAAGLHQSMQIHKMRDADWVRLEQLYEPTTNVPPAPEPIIGREPLPKRGGGFLPTIAPTSRGRTTPEE